MKTIKYLLLLMTGEGRNYDVIEQSLKLDINYVLQWLNKDREHECKLGDDIPSAGFSIVVYPYTNAENKVRAGYSLTLHKYYVDVTMPLQYDSYYTSFGTSLSHGFLQELANTKWNVLYECYDTDIDYYIRFGDTILYITDPAVCNKEEFFNELKYIMENDEHTLSKFVKDALQEYSEEEIKTILTDTRKKHVKMSLTDEGALNLIEQEYEFLYTVLQEVVTNEND